MAVNQTPNPVSDSMANATTGVGPMANNNPVGSAGQPQNPRSAAIKRRLAGAGTTRDAQRKAGNL